MDNAPHELEKTPQADPHVGNETIDALFSRMAQRDRATIEYYNVKFARGEQPNNMPALKAEEHLTDIMRAWTEAAQGRPGAAIDYFTESRRQATDSLMRMRYNCGLAADALLAAQVHGKFPQVARDVLSDNEDVRIYDKAHGEELRWTSALQRQEQRSKELAAKLGAADALQDLKLDELAGLAMERIEELRQTQNNTRFGAALNQWREADTALAVLSSSPMGDNQPADSGSQPAFILPPDSKNAAY